MPEEHTYHLRARVGKKLQEPRLSLRQRMTHMMLEKKLGPASQRASPGPDRNMKNIQGNPLEHADRIGNCEKATVALLTEALGALALCD
jgi:hypothetical protein